VGLEDLKTNQFVGIKVGGHSHGAFVKIKPKRKGGWRRGPEVSVEIQRFWRLLKAVKVWDASRESWREMQCLEKKKKGGLFLGRGGTIPYC